MYTGTVVGTTMGNCRASFAHASQRRGNLTLTSDSEWVVIRHVKETKKKPRLEPLSSNLERLVFVCLEESNVRR
jgi:hypothetical protein